MTNHSPTSILIHGLIHFVFGLIALLGEPGPLLHAVELVIGGGYLLVAARFGWGRP